MPSSGREKVLGDGGTKPFTNAHEAKPAKGVLQKANNNQKLGKQVSLVIVIPSKTN